MEKNVEVAGQPEQLLTPVGVARLLNITRQTVYTAVKDGRLTGIVVGVGKKPILRFRPSDVEAFLSKNATQAMAKASEAEAKAEALERKDLGDRMRATLAGEANLTDNVPASVVEARSLSIEATAKAKQAIALQRKVAVKA